MTVKEISSRDAMQVPPRLFFFVGLMQGVLSRRLFAVHFFGVIRTLSVIQPRNDILHMHLDG